MWRGTYHKIEAMYRIVKISRLGPRVWEQIGNTRNSSEVCGLKPYAVFVARFLMEKFN